MNQARQGSVRSPQAIGCRCSAAKKINALCRLRSRTLSLSWPTISCHGYVILKDDLGCRKKPVVKLREKRFQRFDGVQRRSKAHVC
jgi:hypothetical protein